MWQHNEVERATAHKMNAEGNVPIDFYGNLMKKPVWWIDSVLFVESNFIHMPRVFVLVLEDSPDGVFTCHMMHLKHVFI